MNEGVFTRGRGRGPRGRGHACRGRGGAGGLPAAGPGRGDDRVPQVGLSPRLVIQHESRPEN